MLHHSQKNHVSFTDKFFAPGLRHKIDALGRPAREDDFLSTRRADVLRDALPRLFVSFRRARTQRVQAAMHIGIVVLVKITKRVDHCARFLRSRSAIKINQRMPVGLLAKNWEILTYRMPIDPAGSNLVHPIICYTGRSAPVHSAACIKACCRADRIAAAEL